MLFVPTTPPAQPPAPGRPGLFATFQRLSPYLWPHGRPDLQRRVFLAFGLLLIAKLVTVLMPFTFKWATDALVLVTGNANPGQEAAAPAEWLWRAPILLTVLDRKSVV